MADLHVIDPKAKSREETVAALRRLLDMAEAGEIVEIAAVAIGRNGDTIIEKSALSDRFAVLGAISWLGMSIGHQIYEERIKG